MATGQLDAEVIAAFTAAITRVHHEPGVELYALHEGPGRLVMIEKYESEQARSEHAIDVATALQLYTMGTAALDGEADRLGSITSGKLADLVA